MPAPRRCASDGTPRKFHPTFIICMPTGMRSCCLSVPRSVPLLRSDYSVAGRRPCECENQPIDPTCGMTPFPTVPIWMQPCSPPICKVQGDDPKTACNPATCTYTSCKSPSPTPARACSAALKSYCGDAKKRGSLECGVCVDFHLQQLSKAGCTKAQREKFCGE